MDGLLVELNEGTRRLLLTTTTLTVQGLSISTDNMYIYILTNYYQASIYTSSIAISFRAGALVTASGTYYSQLSSSVSLNNPEFLQSYYKVFASDDYLQA